VAAANKIDLDGKRQVTKAVADDFGFQNQLEFVKETSALSGQGVIELFTDLAKQLLQLPATDGSLVSVTDNVQDQKPSSGCAC